MAVFPSHPGFELIERSRPPMPLNRRQFLATSSLAAAASAVNLRSLIASAPRVPQASQVPPATAFVNLRGTVGCFTGQGGTIGWHIDKTSVVVVDAQFPVTAKICLAGINERSGSRPIDFLVNTHHHADHTSGNVVFRPVTRKIVAQAGEPRLQLEAAARAAKNAVPGAAPQPEQVVADTTYERTWREEVGGEALALKYYGPAHTGADTIVTFEKADVVHMGDLVFNRIHPYIDKPSGASIANWIAALETVTRERPKSTIFIFGHANPRFQPTGTSADLIYMRDYLAALLEFVRGEVKAGRSKEQILGITETLKGFPDHGPLIPRVLSAAYEEIASRPWPASAQSATAGPP
jgi:glyoxylase-like metal-dependent hydrolase (beta-lactamase superfamily II)